MGQKLWGILILLTVLIAGGCASQGQKAKESAVKVPWQSYHEALATGKAESKPVLLHFATDWNKESQRMKRETYGNFDVARYLQKNFSTGWVDVEQFPALARKYDVSSLPTLWILDSQGKSLTSVGGYLGAKKMLLVLEFINTGAYEKLSYDEWKSRRHGK